MPRVLIFYHYFYPDDVVSAQHLTQLGEELQARGWQVIAMPCNRGCRDEAKAFTAFENWNGIEIRRIWRPRFPQSSTIGRILNAMWMVCAWSAIAFKKKTLPNIDALVVGTDPILSIVVAIAWKLVRPKTRVVHWCFDLYPEAAIADGTLSPRGLLVRATKRLLSVAYANCDLIVDIGACMRAKLQTYNGSASKITLTPWALLEPQHCLPVNTPEREKTFGNTKLAVLYSGNFGRAHSYRIILDLARRLRGEDVKFAFSIRGNSAHEVRKAISNEDKNIAFVPFAPVQRLQARLGAADIHLASLKAEWTGTVVPSKLFGSLAVGRPVIFAGSRDSALAKWIETYKVGWVLTAETLDSVVNELKRISSSAEELKDIQLHCYQVYQETFSKKRITDKWDKALRKLPRDGQKQPVEDISIS